MTAPTAREKFHSFQPIADRICRSHCWIKLADGPRHTAESLSDEMIAAHLAGRQAYGACPIEPGGSTVRLACLDLDDHREQLMWRDKLALAAGLTDTLEMIGLTAVPWRSSGGAGIHLYVLWDTPQDAYSVRETLRQCLASCGLQEGTAGLPSQVEIFPKQDAVPATGFGSMLILPGSGESEPLGTTEWPISEPVSVLEPQKRLQPTPSTPSDLKTLVDIHDLEQALARIPNEAPHEQPYDTWRNIIFGIHAATSGSDDGLGLAHSFSARSSKYDPDFLDERVWPYVTQKEGGISAGTIFALAAKHSGVQLQDFPLLEQPTDKNTDDNPHRKYRFLQAAEFISGSRSGYIVKGVIPEAELVVVYGESTAGKSFWALDICMAIATNTPWCDHRVHGGRVAYVVAEGAGGFKSRAQAYSIHHNIPLQDTDIHFLGAAPNLLIIDDVRELVLALKDISPLKLIVIDTLAQSIPGGDENSSESMGRALAHCKVLHKTTGATVLLIHHSGKDISKGARGHSSLRAACDTEIEIAVCEEDRVATVTKQKDGKSGLEFGFKLVDVPLGLDGDNEIIQSAVVSHVPLVPKSQRKKTIRGEHEKTVFRIAGELTGLDNAGAFQSELIEQATRHLIHDPTDGKRDRRVEVTKRALQTLIASNYLVIVPGGRIALAGSREEE